MVAYRIVLLAGAAAALPLNINLGAYSPALVVGDGEISFGGNQDVSALMSTLEGAAVTAANGATTAAAAQPAAAAPAAPAAAASPSTAAVETQAIEQNSVAEPSAVPVSEATKDATIAEQAQQIAALQGMGKVVLPRGDAEAIDDDVDVDANDDEESSSIAKRDFASFDRALKFAEAALQKGPKVQLGTGSDGSGVGIIVDNNQEAAARAGTGTTAAKRDLPGAAAAGPKVKVTTMYVRSGIPSSLQSGEQMTARDLDNVNDNAVPRYETIQIAPNKREANHNPNAIDAVNLNVNGDQGVTMTFVETVEDGEDA
ncbi:hypothetical protein M406DRAFT_59662 [Cryphonectria parasitica EP155]|uniref:Uncharacterized protein n=1 Tax=Cryphonectria parasitica (strain ATCC 38755 / EP155) TaxID=660469 RepID=A0A9P5CTX3_CRYP1|nr:uncharacterized protein M406DRAFT_59662 [Cryphonectria parasitica EP155]KAF3770793.1 hypothetical protein M406DRAFT_59662 [Cryphonectria parasitica EP155]